MVLVCVDGCVVDRGWCLLEEDVLVVLIVWVMWDLKDFIGVDVCNVMGVDLGM